MLGRPAADAAGNDLERPMTIGRMIWVFIPTMTRGLSPVFALLMFGGIWGWRRVWARRDHQALFCTAVVIMCGIWVQLWYDKNICPRYALPIVLMASVFAALGLLGLLAWLLRLGERRQWDGRRQRAMVAAAVALIAAVNLGDAMTGSATYFETRQMAADVGRWVQHEFPGRPTLVGPVGITPIVSYYARSAPYEAFRLEAGEDAILAMVQRSQAGIVLLRPTKRLTAEGCTALAERLKSAGLEPVASSLLPATCTDVYILVRSTAGQGLAQTPTERR